MKLKFLLFALVAVFLVAGNAMALSITDLGQEITILDCIANSTYNGGSPALGIAGEDDEVEWNSVTNQLWDLEGVFWNGSTLSIVGGFDYDNGRSGYSIGDVFIGDSVLDLSRDTNGNLDASGTYNLIGPDFDWVYTGHVVGSAPYQYDSGGTPISMGSYKVESIDMDSYFSDWPGKLGSEHFALQIFASSDVAGLINSGGLVHQTMECGNDTIHASVPEPATMLLLGTGLVCFAGFGRKRLFKRG